MYIPDSLTGPREHLQCDCPGCPNISFPPVPYTISAAQLRVMSEKIGWKSIRWDSRSALDPEDYCGTECLRKLCGHAVPKKVVKAQMPRMK